MKRMKDMKGIRFQIRRLFKAHRDLQTFCDFLFLNIVGTGGREIG
jgi:hypothetical protein